ncbi:MAG: metallophosphoesterase [Deltaproteobacteria bacterium]|nr:metallophosphoesterase [Deltaproteobacteria bacterium]
MSVKAQIVFLLKYSIPLVISLVIQFFLVKIFLKKFPFRSFQGKLILVAALIFNLLFLFIFADYILGLTLPEDVYLYVFVPAVGYQLVTGLGVVFYFLSNMFSVLQPLLRADKKTDSLQNAERRAILAGGIISAVSTAFFIRGIFNARDNYRIKRVIIHVSGLKNSFTAAQITDIHAGWFFGKKKIRELRNVISDLNADLIFFTGDQLHGSHKDFVYQLRDGLEGISSRYGVYQVSGNHDHRLGKEILFSELRKIGITSLDNEVKTLSIKGDKIQIAGIDDIFYKGNIETVLSRLEPSIPSILLSHRPEILDHPDVNNFDAVLAGHTHGGQICIAGKCASDYDSGYRYGIYKRGKTTMFISSGAGVTGPPLRFGSKPEIALITFTGETIDS